MVYEEQHLNDRKKEVVVSRVTPHERRVIEAAVKATHTTISDFIRVNTVAVARSIIADG